MTDSAEGIRRLSSVWRVWVHLPNERNWDIDSYKLIANISSLEQVLEFSNLISDQAISKCMIFIMREGILPIWEDPRNSDGGAFSFKVNHRVVPKSFRHTFYAMVGESLSDSMSMVHGMSVSPKKQFSILKIWVGKNAQTMKISDLDGLLETSGGLYRQHKKTT